MNRHFTLQPGEKLLWEAKPAPRCFTFRNWRHSVLGFLFLILAVYGEVIGIGKTEAFGPASMRWIVLLLFLVGLWFGFGQLFWARREWERVIYAASNRRLWVQRGLLKTVRQSMSLSVVSGYNLHVLGENLATVHVFGRGESQRISYFCIEHPQRLTQILEQAMVESPSPSLVPTPEPVVPSK